MAKAIILNSYGDTTQLQYKEVNIPKPKKDQLLIRVKSFGVNPLDIYQRSGFYKLAPGQNILGVEGAGVIEAKGENTEHFSIGEKVVFLTPYLGSYSEYCLVPERWVAKLPKKMSFEYASAILYKGLMAQTLIRRIFMVKDFNSLLIPGITGGVALILCQWAKFLNANIFGTVSNQKKFDVAKRYGIEYLFDSNSNYSKEVKKHTDNFGVNIVYDGVGQAHLQESLDSLAITGMLVNYGHSSGLLPKFDTTILQQKGSLFFTRPNLWDYISDQSMFILATSELFDMFNKGFIKAPIYQKYHFNEIEDAHKKIEARDSIGSSVVIVD